MLFPVFGQVIGIALSFGLSLGFADKVVQKADSPAAALLMILLLAILQETDFIQTTPMLMETILRL